MLKRVLEVTTACPQTCSIPRELIKKLKCTPRDCLCCAPDDDFEVALCVNCYGGVVQTFTQIVTTGRQIGRTSSPQSTSDLLVLQNVTHDYYCWQIPIPSLHQLNFQTLLREFAHCTFMILLCARRRHSNCVM